jgi:hypothetical protein
MDFLAYLAQGCITHDTALTETQINTYHTGGNPTIRVRRQTSLH